MAAMVAAVASGDVSNSPVNGDVEAAEEGHDHSDKKVNGTESNFDDLQHDDVTTAAGHRPSNFPSIFEKEIKRLRDHFAEDLRDRIDSNSSLGLQALGPASLVDYFRGVTDEADYNRKISKIHYELHDNLSSLFNYPSSKMILHENEADAVLRLFRRLIHQNFTSHDLILKRLPVLYISASFNVEMIRALVWERLLLPPETVSVVSCEDQSERIDIEQFRKLIDNDLNEGRKPLMLMCCLGSATYGHCDNLSAVAELTSCNSIWIHATGSALSLLPSCSPKNEVSELVDSLTLSLPKWYELNGYYFVTLHGEILGVNDDERLSRFASMTAAYWMIFQRLERETIVHRISKALKVVKFLQEQLSAIEGINLIGPSAVSAPPTNSLASHAHVVVWNYIRNERTSAAFNDSLTRWLFDSCLVESDATGAASCLEIIDVTDIGTCVRFSPMECVVDLDECSANITAFIENIKGKIAILNTTEKLREELQNKIADYARLQYVFVPRWAGLGAVRYVPEAWSALAQTLPSISKAQIDDFNQNLVSSLQENDSAYSLGKTSEGDTCVRFGLVTDDSSVSDLLDMVNSTGADLEKGKLYLDTLADVVRKGISSAEQDLIKEHEERLLKEGFLRQVPIVGSMVNWLAPAEISPAGRSLDLNSGKLTNTAELKDTHLQMANGGLTEHGSSSGGAVAE